MKNQICAVLSTYNGEKYIRKQIDSILNQTYKVDKILIIDDVSTDNTINILKEYSSKYSEVECVFNDKNVGPTVNFFNGLKMVDGDYIVFCDQDDIWFPEKIFEQLSHLKNGELDSRYVASFHNAVLIDSDNATVQNSYWQYRKLNFEKQNFEKSLSRNIMTGCTIMINRNFAKLINENLKTYENIIFHDHFISLLSYSIAKVVPISKPLMYYRDHNSSVTSKKNTNMISKVIKNLILLKDNKYLDGNILQAEKFKNDFKSLLDDQSLAALNKFINLKKKNKIFQIFWQFKNK
ncbi:glycosyltransferase family 2 protein [Chryseobacterium sp. 18068]|uniref:glycosyltransferase family 2 protein n=1 Tax=Chryseobacterium sp. 18068 TaxID=2681414 RepID=UPI00135A800A|nr:glycosyltransferase family 2 protein [Chryseobacterium sp. 18068]